MPNAAENEQLKQDIISLYFRYFGSNTAENYKKFYADKDMHTVLISAEELMKEYAGDAKGQQIIADVTKKYSVQKN